MADYSFDPEFAAMLPELPTVSDFSTLEKVQEMREAHSSLSVAAPDRDDVSWEDRSVPGPEGAPEVPVRIYRSKRPAAEPRPCLYEIHGGGFMTGSIEMMDPWCQVIAASVDAVVVSVEYRLAPEHPYPAGHEDARRAFDAVMNGAIAASRWMVAGDSAGGTLAAIIASTGGTDPTARSCKPWSVRPWSKI